MQCGLSLISASSSTYFKFGRKYFPARVPGYSSASGDAAGAFTGWSVLALIAAFCIEFAFRKRVWRASWRGLFRVPADLLMSVLFIAIAGQTREPGRTKPNYCG